VFPLKSKEKL
jgi:hypothetical protein